jgi:hypothetical protein
MSTLKVNTIQNTSGGSSSTPEQMNQGRAKAWANIRTNGTNIFRDSFGFSSITDVGNNTARLDFSTSFSNTNYAVICGAIEDDASNTSRTPRVANHTRKNLVSNQIFVSACDMSDGARDVEHLMVACFGDM